MSFSEKFPGNEDTPRRKPGLLGEPVTTPDGRLIRIYAHENGAVSVDDGGAAYYPAEELVIVGKGDPDAGIARIARQMYVNGDAYLVGGAKPFLDEIRASQNS